MFNELKGRNWGHFLNGKALDFVEKDCLSVYAPATNEVIARCSNAGTKEVDEAVALSKAGFAHWSAIPAPEREKIIRKATAYVRTKADEIGYLMALEQGKPFAQSKSEVTGSCDLMDYFAAESVRIEGYSNPTEKANLYSWVTYQPVGVCGLITPWNYPVSLLSWKLGPALAAGCTCVVKPTEITPLSPLAFCMALIEGGLPAGTIQVVLGGGETGAELVRHPDVAKVAMTGSTATGRKIAQSAAFQLKKISLELGGHCPAIVCEDADLDNAAEIIAYKGFRNMGQSCSSVNRVFVHESIYEPLLGKLVTQAKKLSIGDGIEEPACELGPMTTTRGLQHVKDHVEDALNKGAKLIVGGKQPEGEKYAKGNYYLPTVIADANESMQMMSEETFGPVIPVAPFKDLEEAVSKANDSNFGLCAYLFSRNYSTIMKVSQALESGTVCVNNGAVNTTYGPYEGWKNSGFGLELSRKSIFEYLKTKHIKIASL